MLLSTPRGDYVMNIFQKIKMRRAIKRYLNRPLDIAEIVSRDSDMNVVADAYECFMRKYHWEIEECCSDCVRVFLLCVLFEGEIGSGGISQFLAGSSGNYAHQTADALHIIGASDAEMLLRKSFELFPDGIVPANETDRNNIMDGICESVTMTDLDAKAYDTDISRFCYKYLMMNKERFLACK